MNEIPSELCITIISHISEPDIYSLANTSKSWNEIIKTQKLLKKNIIYGSVFGFVIIHKEVDTKT